MTHDKTCRTCGESRPLGEFHARNRGRGSGDVQADCKACQSTRGGGQTQVKVNRVRARHRAVADLIAFHEAEFETLLAIRVAEATEEAEALAATSEAKKHYGDGKGGPIRLRPGKRKKGQQAGDRIDVARCPHCIRHHDRGHECGVCGAAPGETLRDTRNANRVTQRVAPRNQNLVSSPSRPPKGIDPAALAEFNRGTQRARDATP